MHSVWTKLCISYFECMIIWKYEICIHRENSPITQTTQSPTLCNECQICLRFHWILKVILEMAFLEHCTKIWKLNRISMTILIKVARKCICCCRRVHQCMTAPILGGKCAVELENVVKVATLACSPYVRYGSVWVEEILNGWAFHMRYAEGMGHFMYKRLNTSYAQDMSLSV